jgi:excisionase family DNA binding protein
MTANTALSVQQAAALLNVSTTTIYAQARAGTLPAHRIGAAWRFFESELLTSTRHDPWARSARSMAAVDRRRKPSVSSGNGRAGE